MREQVYEFLNANKIKYEVTEHAPVYTMAEMEAEGLDKIAPICKNLFVRDGKGKRHFLVVASNDTTINLKELGDKLQAPKLRFASEERLAHYLGVESGCVSPFGVLNDENHEVEVILDQKLQGLKKLGVHPNENTATIWISFMDLRKALKLIGNEAKIVKI